MGNRCIIGIASEKCLNLVVNARDAVGDGEGAIVIRTANVVLSDRDRDRDLNAPPGHYVMLAVSDTGGGMEAEVKAHLFEPFFTTKAIGQGVGLGLSVVYGIVQQNAGDIAVDSEPGEGAQFRVYFPQVMTPVPNEGSHEGPISERGTILLVEDEPHVREPIREMLELQGYQVIEAADANEALQCVERCEVPFDMLLTDVIMPGKNGYELAIELRAQYPNMPILLMSGHTDNILKEHSEAQSALGFLQKPFTPDILATKVRDVLAQSLPRSLD